jgi:CRP-like cAMP-binding protein
MTSGQYLQLYKTDTAPDSAYLLNGGQVFFFVTESDKYVIKGKNVIVGATELILRDNNPAINRLETAISTRDASIKKISPERFLNGLNVFSFLLNVSMVIAKQVVLTNNIIDRNFSGVDPEQAKDKDNCVEYFRIVSRIREEYEKRKMPWLKDIVKKYETSLTYKKGEAFSRTIEPVLISTPHELSNNMIEYNTGSFIFEEHSMGTEMYILESGTLDVVINGKKVAVLQDKGSVIGEIAMLLGQKRTASLKARNNVVVTRITKEDLRGKSDKGILVLKSVAVSLSQKHSNNITRIHEINESLVEKHFDNDDQEKTGTLNYSKNYTELVSLKNQVEKTAQQKDAQYLNDILH